MDIVLQQGDTIQIIDIKSDRTLPESIPKHHPYHYQLLLYSLAAAHIWPNKTISASLHFIRHHQTVPLTFSAKEKELFSTQLSELVK